MSIQKLALPGFYNPAAVSDFNRYVKYDEVEAEALRVRRVSGVPLAATDKMKVALVPIDVQRTFCDPAAQLFVGGRSGTGAIDDSRRLCEFVYANAAVITSIHPTLDTHRRAQVFHPAFWVDKNGNHPAPMTMISLDDLDSGRWRPNPAAAFSVLGDANGVAYLEAYARHYVKALSQDGKYLLMIWPYHAMLGGNEYALVPSVHEAFFYHAALREVTTSFEIKGGNPLTENYAVTHPEVLTDHRNTAVAKRNVKFLETLLANDMVLVAGQAKSHCVAWSIQGILDEIASKDPTLAKKVYLLEDLTSPVVIPGVIDFTDQADAAFERFRAAGMNVVKSTDPIESWPGVAKQLSI
jgi:nicotinamidase-related amidase